MTQIPLTTDERREKYRQERDKRIRPDGNAQYQEPFGRFSNLLLDPYTTVEERKPVSDEVTVVIIGGGFAGLVTGARLKQQGINDIRIIDKAGDVGGVWYWNRYPGAMCDTAAMIYLPLLEETGTVPSAKYVRAPEIYAHAQKIATTFGLYENALLSTGITRVEWDEDDSRWIITTDRGDKIRAQFVAMGTGPLHRPKLPGIPGIDSFAGHAFHTSRWDYEYTGGDATGAAMTHLNDKRVGIIGTGATAVQCVSPLAASAHDLFVFQRTPSSIDVRNNQDIDPKWFAGLDSGWQKKWMMNFAILQTGGFADEDLVKDGWTDISQRIRDRLVDLLTAGSEFTPESFLQAYEASDDEKMDEIRVRVDRIVRNPKTAEALKPWYRQLCKRPCFHDEYLQAFNQPNVHLIDTDGKGVTRIDALGVWVEDEHFDLDCLIFASGFEVGTDYARRSGFETTGRNGLTLSEHWHEGMRTLHGIHSHGFPNLFILGITQGANLISNIPQNFVESGTTIAQIIASAIENNYKTVEASAAAQDAWVALLETNTGSVFGDSNCTPGYYNNEGQPIGVRERRNSIGYPEGPIAYFEYIDQWRESGEYAGLEFI